MGYPLHDDQFEDKVIEKAERQKDGTVAITCSGWTLWCGKDWKTMPTPGQTARQYGKGIGFPVRGLFIDGEQVWYRTEAEEREHHEISLYGADAADWLARWDKGDSVWSIEMGGLGPGYEQCIQITAAEVLRWLLANKPDLDKEWATMRDKLDREVGYVDPVKKLGLSGAQWGAGVSLAAHLYRQGPRAIMSDDKMKDRHIQVCRAFPQ